MLMRFFISIDLIGCDGDINKSEFLQAVRIRRVRCIRCVRHVRWWGKYQDFMLMRFFISIDMIGCGGDINQSDSCKQCA